MKVKAGLIACAFILIIALSVSVAAAGKDTAGVVDLSKKNIDVKEFSKTNGGIHFKNDVKNVRNFEVRKDRDEAAVHIELSDDAQDIQHVQTIGVPVSDLPGFTELVRIDHFDEAGRMDYTNIVKPKIVDDIAYIDVEFTSVTITPYISFILNAGFENWTSDTVPANWTLGAYGGNRSSEHVSGNYSYRIDGNGENVRGEIWQQTAITPNNYTVGMWIKITGRTSGILQADIQGGSPSVDTLGAVYSANTDDWVWVESRQYINSNNPRVRIFTNSYANAGSVFYVDDIILSTDYTFAVSETNSAGHVYQNFTYTPAAVYPSSKFVTEFGLYNLTLFDDPVVTVKVDGVTKNSYVSGNRVFFDSSGLSAAIHNVNITVAYVDEPEPEQTETETESSNRVLVLNEEDRNPVTGAWIRIQDADSAVNVTVDGNGYAEVGSAGGLSGQCIVLVNGPDKASRMYTASAPIDIHAYLPDYNDCSLVEFSIIDYTNQFPFTQTQLIITKTIDNIPCIVDQRKIDAGGICSVYLRTGDYYTLTLVSPYATKSLGGFSTEVDQAVSLVVGSIRLLPESDANGGFTYNITHTNQSVTMAWADPNHALLTDFNYRVYTSNGTVVHSLNSMASMGETSYSYSDTDEIYKVKFEARTVAGNISHIEYVSGKTNIIDLQISKKWYNMISIFVIFLIMLTFGAKSAAAGAVISGLLTAGLYAIGLLQVSGLIVSICVLLGVIAVLRGR